MVSRRQENYHKAVQYYHTSLAITERALGPDHPSTAVTVHNLGLVMMRMGELEMAMRHFERAVETLEAAMGEAHPFLGQARDSLKKCDSALQEQERIAGGG